MSSSAVEQRQQPKEHTLVHFDIPASDPAKLSKFYSNLFGWQFTKFEGQEYWLVATKDAKDPMQDAMGGMYKREGPSSAIINYFNVKNIDQAVNNAKNLGAKVVTEKTEIPMVGWSAVLTDPENNVFAFFQAAQNSRM